jgi:hypothetical protein
MKTTEYTEHTEQDHASNAGFCTLRQDSDPSSCCNSIPAFFFRVFRVFRGE